MHLSQVIVILAAVIGNAFGVGYGSGGSYGGGGGSYGGGGAGGYSGGSNLPPQPFSFNYEARDEQGNVHFRQEQGDQSGTVKGSYGYTDVQGLNRVVDYVSDAGGFRASIQTNEPGVGEDSPADVVLVARPPPGGIQERYTRGGAGAGGYSGSGAHAGGSGGGFGRGAGLGVGGYSKPRSSGKSGY